MAIRLDIDTAPLRELKMELRSLKDELSSATDPEQMGKLAERAGQVKDRITDINEQVAVFSAGSKFEVLSNSLGDVGSKLKSLDFSGAKESAQNLIKISKTLTFGEAVKGIKDMSSTFISLGKALLSNPLFLIAGVIALLVIAIVKLLDKIGVLKAIMGAIGAVFKWVGDIINDYLIQPLKDLCDWFGFTDNAAIDNAQVMAESAEKVAKTQEKRTESVTQSLDNEIRMAELQGKNTESLERKKVYLIEFTAKKRYEADYAAAKAAALKGDLDKEEIAALYEKARLSGLVAKQASADSKFFEAETAKNKKDTKIKDVEQDKKDKADASERQSKANADAKKKQEDYNNARIAAARQLKDLEIENLTDGIDKEIAKNNEKYLRAIEDLKKNEKYKAEEKAKIISELEEQQNNSNQKLIDADNKSKLEKEENYNKALSDLMTNANISEQEQLKTKYDSDKSALDKQLKDKIYSQEQYNALLTQMDINYKLSKEELDKEWADRELMAQLELGAVTLEGRKALLDAQMKVELDSKELTESEKKLIEDKYRKQKEDLDNKEVDDRKKVENAKLNMAKDAFNVLGELATLFAGKNEAAQKRAFNINKAAGIANATISTYQGAASAFAETPGGPIIKGIAAGIAVAAGIANVVKIASTKFGGTSTPSPTSQSVGSIPTDTSTTQATPSFNLFGSGGDRNSNIPTDNNNNNNGSENVITVNAIVSETQITNVQNKIKSIKTNSEL